MTDGPRRKLRESEGGRRRLRYPPVFWIVLAAVAGWLLWIAATMILSRGG